MGSESVKVVVRCRPLSDRETAVGSKMVLTMDLQRCQCFIKKPMSADEPPKQFTFDGTYFTDQTTEQMYNESAYPLVEVSFYGVITTPEAKHMLTYQQLILSANANLCIQQNSVQSSFPFGFEMIATASQGSWGLDLGMSGVETQHGVDIM